MYHWTSWYLKTNTKKLPTMEHDLTGISNTRYIRCSLEKCPSPEGTFKCSGLYCLYRKPQNSIPSYSSGMLLTYFRATASGGSSPWRRGPCWANLILKFIESWALRPLGVSSGQTGWGLWCARRPKHRGPCEGFPGCEAHNSLHFVKIHHLFYSSPKVYIVTLKRTGVIAFLKRFYF